MFRPTLVFAVTLIISLAGKAQGYDPSRVSKKAQTFFTQAQQRAADGHFASAVGLLQQSLAADSTYVDAMLALASLYGQQKNYRQATAWHEKAIRIDSTYTLPYRHTYSVQLAGMGEFARALNAVNQQLSRQAPKNPTALERLMKSQRAYQFGIDYARLNPDTSYVFAPRNAGPGVNSAESEYFPWLSLDRSELVFTRRVRDINEDFFVSTADSGTWKNAIPLPGQINTPRSEAAQTISPDGQWLFFTARDRADNIGGYDLYFSYRTPLGWSAGENMGFRVNSDQWDSQPCIAPDKNELYFASRRPGGLGGSDIYVTRRVNGKWQEAENLGPGINTAGDDQCPFIHADNQTLYFTSNGWPGYGNNDLFVARRQPDGSWGQPVNLGYPINTIDDEGTLFIAADGVTAYYASDRSDSRGGLDIYHFELRPAVRPFQTRWVKGIVTDRKTGQPLDCTLELIDLNSRQRLHAVSTAADGSFLLTLPVGKNYAFEISRPGYLFYSDQFLLEKSSGDSAFVRTIRLQPVEVNATLVLKNIFFETGRFDLKPESMAELDKLAQWLTDNPRLRVEIGGHTDSIGRAAANLNLSQQRAWAVVSYLTGKKIEPARLTAKGYGATRPVGSNKTEAGRALNRRTELKVLAQ